MSRFSQMHWRGVMLKNFMVIVLDAVVLFGEGCSVVLKNVVCRSHRRQMLSVHVVSVVRVSRHSVVVRGGFVVNIWLLSVVSVDRLMLVSVVALLDNVSGIMLRMVIVVN